jgi:hypothetical protein
MTYTQLHQYIRLTGTCYSVMYIGRTKIVAIPNASKPRGSFLPTDLYEVAEFESASSTSMHAPMPASGKHNASHTAFKTTSHFALWTHEAKEIPIRLAVYLSGSATAMGWSM